MDPPSAANAIEAELRKLIPKILADAAPSRPPPDPPPAGQRDWSNTLEIIERAADWSRALDRQRLQCEIQANELMKEISEERRRGEERVRQAEAKIRAIEAHAAELEKRLHERESQRQALLSRVAVTSQEAMRAEANAQRVERWLDRLHLSIKAWLSAAQEDQRDRGAPIPQRRPLEARAGETSLAPALRDSA